MASNNWKRVAQKRVVSQAVNLREQTHGAVLGQN